MWHKIFCIYVSTCGKTLRAYWSERFSILKIAFVSSDSCQSTAVMICIHRKLEKWMWLNPFISTSNIHIQCNLSDGKFALVIIRSTESHWNEEHSMRFASPTLCLESCINRFSLTARCVCLSPNKSVSELLSQTFINTTIFSTSSGAMYRWAENLSV